MSKKFSRETLKELCMHIDSKIVDVEIKNFQGDNRSNKSIALYLDNGRCLRFYADDHRGVSVDIEQ